FVTHTEVERQVRLDAEIILRKVELLRLTRIKARRLQRLHKSDCRVVQVSFQVVEGECSLRVEGRNVEEPDVTDVETELQRVPALLPAQNIGELIAILNPALREIIQAANSEETTDGGRR